VSVRLSVRPSVTGWCSTKTAKLRIMQATPYNSPETNGVTPTEEPNKGKVDSNGNF